MLLICGIIIAVALIILAVLSIISSVYDVRYRKALYETITDKNHQGYVVARLVDTDGEDLSPEDKVQVA